MINKLESLVRKYFSEDVEPDLEANEDTLMIATAVLFLEMAYADFKITPEEEEHLKSTLAGFFSIPDDDVSELIEVAREKRSQRHDIWFFSNLINTHFDRPQKLWILEHLWKMIYADGKVDKYEDHLIRKISTLIGLSHQEMIQAKLKATQLSAP
jgi:uncharacterized tellurite resistance protein B-like protein